MRIMRGFSTTVPRAAIFASARFMPASSVSWVINTTGTASAGVPRRAATPPRSRPFRSRVPPPPRRSRPAGPHHQAHVVSAAMALHRRGRELDAARRPAPKTRAYARRARCRPDRRRPPRRSARRRRRALRTRSADEIAFGHHRVEHTVEPARSAPRASTMQGWTRCSMPCGVGRAMPSSLMR